MIPRVKISVSEDTASYYTTNVNFVPTVIIKQCLVTLVQKN